MKPKLILVAEDEPDMARLVEHHLLRRGWRVKLSPDGIAALDVVVELRPDLIVLDLMMPRMDGLELCRLLKNNPMTRHIPIIMLTALADMQTKREGYRCGADDYIIKPFGVRELLTRVDSLLRPRETDPLPASFV
jgi:DNA-binding response OmpR family regulator